jgi:ketosteroid isomerase-like protein
METNPNISAIKGIYEDFGRGNIEGILARLGDDVHWEELTNSDIPYAGKRQGKAAVREFFQAIAQIDVSSFDPQEYISAGDRVIVCGQWGGRVRATGKTFLSRWAMLWTLKDGKVARFMCYEDTASTAAAFRK